MGTAFVKGLQGNNEKYLKTVATAKHYAVHSGPEYNRHSFDVRPPLRDVWDTYLPAFEKLIKSGHAYSVMCAYNRFEGEPCCGSDELLVDILRNRWGFKGYVSLRTAVLLPIFIVPIKLHPMQQQLLPMRL